MHCKVHLYTTCSEAFNRMRAYQDLPQRLIVGDNSVVDHSKRFFFINMRMAVEFGRRAMGSPTCVCQTTLVDERFVGADSFRGKSSVDFNGKAIHVPCSFDNIWCCTTQTDALSLVSALSAQAVFCNGLADAYPGWVVSPVLQSAQPCQQKVHDVSPGA